MYKGPVVRIAAFPPSGTTLNRMVATARHNDPALAIRRITFPDDGGVLVQGQATAWLVRDRANAVLFDNDAKPAGTITGERLTARQRIAEAADPLHFGTWGGVATRWLWFASGVVLTGIAVTGVLILTMRTAREQRREISLVAASWRAMGPAAWPIAIVGIAIVRAAAQLE